MGYSLATFRIGGYWANKSTISESVTTRNTLAVSSSLVVTVRWPSGENTALTTRLVWVPGFSRFGCGVLCGAAKTSVGSRIRVNPQTGSGHWSRVMVTAAESGTYRGAGLAFGCQEIGYSHYQMTIFHLRSNILLDMSWRWAQSRASLRIRFSHRSISCVLGKYFRASRLSFTSEPTLSL